MTPEPFTTQPLIGLEIHVQLATRTKLFCPCPVAFAAPPNSRVCPVCLGLPGALPVINKQALRLGARLALALNCTIAQRTRWDRKSYYYPDLPKNYQISQYDLPLAERGNVQFASGGTLKSARIKRAHLEEDAGKNLHDAPEVTRIDLNRTGTPLLEIVTEPDLHSAEETYDFCVELQRLASYLGVSEAVMQKGQMRFEPNINVIITENDQQWRTPICEVKNLNSFRAIRGAVDYEINRQLEAWKKDRRYAAEGARENRGWDDKRNVTVYQRVKEEVHDYRYFPDPDLVPVHIDSGWQDEIRRVMPEMPLVRQARLADQCGISQAEASQVVADRATADLFDDALAAGADPGTLGKHFITFWSRHANDQNTTIADLGIDAERLAELTLLQRDDRITATAAATIAAKLVESSEAPSVIARSEGLELMQDASAIEALVDAALADNPKAVEIIKAGGKKSAKSLGFLQGQVMQRSKGSAPPKRVREMLIKKLGAGER